MEGKWIQSTFYLAFRCDSGFHFSSNSFNLILKFSFPCNFSKECSFASWDDISLNLKPFSQELKSRLFDCYHKLNCDGEAYVLMKEVLEQEPDNQAVMLVGGQVALKCGDTDLCLQLWEKAADMPDENLAQMVS